MSAQIREESTLVPLSDGEDVEIEPGQPWPSPYRGSKYSLVWSHKQTREHVVRWEYYDLNVFLDPPRGLRAAAKRVGKSQGSGEGSFRITADGEVLTKVTADDYPNVREAPVSSGWIPVYLGKLHGDLGFTDVENDPDRLDGADIAVWEGLPFKHGETWTVGVDGSLHWKWRGYRFSSAFDHSELVARYKRYRSGGRMYVNEYGHVFMNVDADSVPKATEDIVISTYEDWHRSAERDGRNAALRLVNRRLRSTSKTGDPEDGLLPMYIGHLSDFDGGVIPKPVVDDPSYFGVCGRQESDDW